MSDITPFLASMLAADAEVRPYAQSLPSRMTAPARSPWTPSADLPALGDGSASAAEDIVAAARAEAAKLRADALEAGRAEAQRELAEQRVKLDALAAELIRTQAARDAHAADVVSGAAIAVIEAWLGRAITGGEKFAPVVRGWLASGNTAGDTAVARVNPADVAAMREAAGSAAITVVADAAVVLGDVRISVGSRELYHSWSERLGELRIAIATSVAEDGAKPAEPSA